MSRQRAPFPPLPASARLAALGLSAALLPVTALAQQPPTQLPEIVVHGASTVPVEALRVGSAVTVVTEEQIRDQGATSVPDVLRLVPGVAVNQSGGRGGLTQLRLRGAEANQTLIVVDGIPINDVNSGDADLANIPVDAIERIEVVRGPQSGIWGPNAQAGVILITTKSGRGLTRPEVTARIEGGSFGTMQGSATVRGAQGPFYGALSISGLRSGGFVVAPGTTRPNGSDMGAFTAKIGADLSEWFNVEAVGRLVSRTGFYNPGVFAYGPPCIGFFCTPDPQTGLLANGTGRGVATDAQGRIVATFKLLEGAWTHRFSADASHQTTNSRSSYLSSFGFLESEAFWSKTERTRAEYRTAYTFETPSFLGARHTIVGGVEAVRERFRYYYESDGFFGYSPNDSYATTGRARERKGLYGEYLLSLQTGFALSAALRHDWNSSFRNATTWRLTAAQSFETGTRLHASIGKGVTNPTFFEQFGFFANFTGNPALRPESSIGWDAGVEQRWFGGRLVTDVTVFRASIQDAIVLSGGTAINLPFQTTRQGVEVTATARPADWLRVVASYTYTDTRSAELVSGVYVAKEALRRPRHAASLSATATLPDDKTKVTLTVAHNGNMRDTFFGPAGSSDVRLGAYTLVGAQISHDLTRNATIYLRGENLFGQRFQEVYGYQGPGAAVYGGLRVRFGD
ncbi:MAG: TonB-dependent receptor [Phreatobacter sp.]|uniref:TonB-dependent receptor plug domain-containing protein n=1 Tax=Phreatobacter sp. TaxID=1966341 RepID=UPI001A59ED19|nr:TonB-dependent receptor [Phreatobacter sp.]MBL8568247.1 TonB-dependent receptor [Phreatobacter sp.]